MNLLLTCRRRIEQQCTTDSNALYSWTRQTELRLDTGRALPEQKISENGSWRSRPGDGLKQRIARQEATESAIYSLRTSARLKSNEEQLTALSVQLPPGRQGQPGLGPVAQGNHSVVVLTPWSIPFRSHVCVAGRPHCSTCLVQQHDQTSTKSPRRSPAQHDIGHSDQEPNDP